MKLKITIVLLELAMLALIGCGPSEEEIAEQTAIAETATAASWTKTPTLTNTPTSTSTPTSTNTPTSTSTPTETLTPTVTPTPIQIWPTNNCSSVPAQPEQVVQASGYLSIPAGSYSKNASRYVIWLKSSQWDEIRMGVRIRSGNRPNSMYFSGNSPRILDNQEEKLPWVSRWGQTVYITFDRVTVTGIWSADCYLEIEIIEIFG